MITDIIQKILEMKDSAFFLLISVALKEIDDKKFVDNVPGDNFPHIFLK